MIGEKLPFEKWPEILYRINIEQCLGISRTDAAKILRTAPVLDQKKRRYRAITKKNLIKFLEGESA